MTDKTELRAAFEAFWEEERQRTWDAADMPSHRGTSPSKDWSSDYKERTWIGFQAGHASTTQQRDGLRKDAERLEFLEDELFDLQCVETSEDDYTWQVVSHHMDAPKVRVVGCGATARKAIDHARHPHVTASTGAASSPVSTDSAPTANSAEFDRIKTSVDVAISTGATP